MEPNDESSRRPGTATLPDRPALAVQDRRWVRPRLWVKKLEPDLESGWERLAAFHTDATLFHELAWRRAIEQSYGQTPHYLVAGIGTRVTGILPLFEVSGPFTGRALVSVPYGVYGGILAEDPATERALFETAKELQTRIGARYLELRQREPLDIDDAGELGELGDAGDAGDPGLQPINRYVTFRKPLPAESKRVLAELPRKARAAARQARDRHKLTATFGLDQLDVFYPLYVRSLRRLGSPPYSKRFLRAVLEAFGERATVLLVREGWQPRAGVIAIRFRDEMFAYVSGADERFAHLQINNFMYLVLMEESVRQGLRVFDLGRTRKDNPGPYAFKCNQGFEPRDLPYRIHLREGERLPNVTPSNKAFSWPRKVWRRLPTPVVRSLGALLTRWIP